jgi:hypothetical protein
MARIKRVRSCASVMVVTVGLLLSVACGGGSSSMSQGLTARQAQAVSQEIAAAAQAALQTSITGAARERQGFGQIFAESAVRDASPNASGGCVTSASGTTCNFPVSYSGACPQGGTIGITGDFNFTLNNAGDGSDSTTLTITPASCAASNVTFSGDPNVTIATQVNFQNDAPVYPITLTESGGISYGPNPTGSCSVNATMTITSSQTCTVSGNICGQTLSGNCLPPTN